MLGVCLSEIGEQIIFGNHLGKTGMQLRSQKHLEKRKIFKGLLESRIK